MKRIRINTWFYGLLSISLTILLVGYNIHMQKKLVLQEAHSNASNLINLVEMDLVRTFSVLDQIFMGLESHLTPGQSGQQIDPPEIRRIIDDLVLQNSYLASLIVLDQQGRILHWNNNFQKPNLGERAYFQIHRSRHFDGLFFGLPHPSIMSQGQWIAGISKAVRNPDQSLDMVLTAIVDLKYFEQQYQALLTTPGTTLRILSPDRHLYAIISNLQDPPQEHLGQQIIDPSTVDGNSKAGQELTLRKTIANYPLQVEVTRPETAVLAAWTNSARNLAALGLVISMLLLFMTWRTTIHQRRQLQIKTEMHERAGTDPLTELPNQSRALAMAHLEIKKAVRKQSPLALILLDLDLFKSINQIYSRQTGDEVLQETTGILRECSRATDILSRHSGSTFLLLLPDTPLQGGLVLARKIHEKLAKKSYVYPAGEFRMTASLGVSQWDPGEKEIEPALQRAAAALHEVKKNGRNNIRWMPSGLGNGDLDGSVVWLHTNDRSS